MRPVGDWFEHKADKHREDESGGIFHGGDSSVSRCHVSFAFLSLQTFHQQPPSFLKTEYSVAKASVYSGLTTHQVSALALPSLLPGHFNKPVTQVQLPHTAPLGEEGESQD